MPYRYQQTTNWQGIGHWGHLLALTLLCGFALPAAALETTCHIHPPDQAEDKTAPATLIGPFATETRCEQMRASMFGAGGRCHCVRGFASPRFGAPFPDSEFMPGEAMEQPLP